MFRRIDTTHFHQMKELLSRNPKLLDTLRILDSFNLDLEKCQGIGFEDGSLKQTLAFKIQQILNIVTHNLCEKTQQTKMINYVHSWALS